MKKGYDWLYLLAALLALIALGIRLYDWQARGDSAGEALVPGLFLVALLAMWWSSRARRQRGNG
jgi:hypothetical protein